MLPEPSAAADAAARSVVDAALVVHRSLGSGLREDHYRQALAAELRALGHHVRIDHPVRVRWRGQPLNKKFILDMLVDEVLVVELKAKHRFHTEDFRQTSSYLAATGFELALVLNFNAPLMKQGIKRVIRSRETRQE